MKLRAASILVIIGLMASGCAIAHTGLSTGKEYNLDNTLSVQKGMSREEITKLLGKPYAIGKDYDGNAFFIYEQMHTSSSGFAAGVFVQGIIGSQKISGGKATVVFDKVTQKVRTIEYEIYGVDNYDKLRGGQHEKHI
ncbi:MAG: hypothetical protein HQL09_10245 [Nitrospirae bacterium]|nr:hypothetical protein [Nitrospirota bacterium]